MPEYVSYEEFGRNFFEVAVTESRIGAAFSAIAGEEFQVGPLPAGPGGVVKVVADVRIAEPRIERHVGELITFTVKLPLAIGLLIDLKLDRIHYDVEGLITLPLTVRCAKPLELRIEVDPPAPRDVVVDVNSRNMRGEIIRNLAQVDAEIRRVIAKTVAEEIDKPEVRKARYIDVATELSRALDGDLNAEAEAIADVAGNFENAIAEVAAEAVEALARPEPNAPNSTD
ncbi:MAG: hypothetical protein WAW85_12725 [Gordonia sp. (in: high G+C Gram-positive bacteria)]|uniref:hypothetical protein n=1 Tax=Gordonia sp. (in: high G+C Gram-positive bacteria) TaxID=84139 RepID=UPI003BB7B93A